MQSLHKASEANRMKVVRETAKLPDNEALDKMTEKQIKIAFVRSCLKFTDGEIQQNMSYRAKLLLA